MSTNRITLAQAVQMPVTELAKLPIDHLALLLEDVTALKTQGQKAADHMHAAMHLRYGGTAADRRRERGSDTGTVRLDDGGMTVLADLPKRVAWDQDGLAQVEKRLAEMGEPAGDYIKTERQVAERAFQAWPASLRKLFAPHRTEGAGKPTYKIEAKRGEG